MKILEAKNYHEMSSIAASMIIEKVRFKPDANLGLATGGTPIGLYQELIRDYRSNGTSYEKVCTYNLDEYVGIDSEDTNSYRYFMEENLFAYINVPESHIHIPDGTAEDLEAECNRYDLELSREKGIDIQILGIGSNGHIGFNEPGTSFSSHTHIIELAEITRKANARFFQRLEDVPTHAITMGIASILKAKQIILLVSGLDKAEVMKQLLTTDEVNEQLPASALKNHHNVTILADEEALSLIKKEDLKHK
ncbi:glucosamine-6-phosphate deaminase [Fictibacillus norfolkensis]|jgi:glucosamine-6-phosphate deaminase|uniref:Glucosamine-6-phosphate deaminase n=1 Tax=Fictibacillus norfolkensis TaxID=2762233 RepID=A0ABR8SID4_9BACL|nr:glucosamine-6-phosphate deaminase [Fictibacillus norfolkensis]MBD7963230.1 glucosamine-6-phosphate deaminase [Fictibacillus norfolkensis]